MAGSAFLDVGNFQSGGLRGSTDVMGPAAHGGVLSNLMATEPLPEANHKMQLSERQVCDLELLLNGGFSPLQGFMTESEYISVVEEHRTDSGALFGMPVVLDTNDEAVQVGDYVMLSHKDMGGDLAVLLVESKYEPDKTHEAIKVYGTEDKRHPAVNQIFNDRGRYYLGGRVFGVQMPQRDWVHCLTPREVRNKLHADGPCNVVAFQCRNPIHRVHASMIMNVAREHDANVIVHPVVGPTKDDDIPARTRMLTYEAVRPRLEESGCMLEYLPYNMMVGGPREALQHMLVRKNYGCTHMIVGRDHAGCKIGDSDVYGAYDAQEFINDVHVELGMTPVQFQELVWVPEHSRYVPGAEAKAAGYKVAKISGTELRRRLRAQEPIPEWYAFPEVVSILREHS